MSSEAPFPTSSVLLPNISSSSINLGTVSPTPPTVPTVPPTGSPLVVILAAGIVGGLALLGLILVSLFVLCFLGRRGKPKRKSDTENGNGARKRSRKFKPDSRPLYAQVFRHASVGTRSSSQRPKTQEDKTVRQPPKSTTSNHVKPEEIPAFSIDIPNTFRPFAPPPRRNTHNAQTIGEDNNRYQRMVYKKPEEPQYDFLDSIDGDVGITQSLQIPGTVSDRRPMSNGKPAVPLRSKPYQGIPPSASVQAETCSLTSSVQQLTLSIRSDTTEGYYQRPSSKPSTLPRKKGKMEENRIYSEQLDPRMFQNSPTVERGSVPLPYPPIYDRPRPVTSDDQPIHVLRQNIVEIQDLGMGRFGRVVLAATTGLSLKDLKLGENNNKSRSLLVAIKKLKEDADPQVRETFEAEIKFMSKLKHANVARLLGVCFSNEPFLMMEYMEKGDLHEFLQKQTLVSDTVDALGDNEITPLVLLYMGVQIASGMRYLAKKKFVHRDLATRNCLVGQDFVVKISDFGMSRNLYDSSYYLVQGRVILPIRWMAHESFYGKFSTSSDAWSYGITLWEIYSLAQHEPYGEMTDEEFIADTIRGERRKLLERPASCPKEVYDVMLRCWIHETNMRADFEEIYSRLFLAYSKMSK